MDTPLLLLWTLLLLGASLQDSMRVSPDMSQFFRGSTLNLRCVDVMWGVLWNTSRGSRRRCGQDEHFINSGSWCKVKYLEAADSGQYWCESPGGATSDPIHITVIDRGVVLQMSVLPVASGKSVSLFCRHHSDSSVPARFYRNGNFLSEEPSGHMTIQQVALSDKGQYHCQIRGERSAPVELRVLAVSSSDPMSSNSTAAPSPSSTSPLLVPLVGSAVGLVLLILLVLTVVLVRCCRRQKTKGSRAKRRRTQTPQTPQTNVSKGKSKNKKQPKICQKCQKSFSP